MLVSMGPERREPLAFDRGRLAARGRAPEELPADKAWSDPAASLGYDHRRPTTGLGRGVAQLGSAHRSGR